MLHIVSSTNIPRYQSKVSREIYSESEWREIIRVGILEGLTSDTTTFERMIITGRLVEVKSDVSTDMRTGGKFI